MKSMLLAACLLLVTAVPAHAAQPATTISPSQDNPQLRILFDQDQGDRKDGKLDWAAINARDAIRRERVGELLREGRIRTANDYRHAAFVFQHGDDAAAYRLAHALATLAMTLDDSQQNRWIVAASWDRLLMSRLQPQWYGTQFRSDSRGLYLYPVADEAISDEERKRMVGLTLDESRARGAEIAKASGQTVRNPAPTIEQLRAEAATAKPED